MKTPLITAIAAVLVIGGAVAIWQITKNAPSTTDTTVQEPSAQEPAAPQDTPRSSDKGQSSNGKKIAFTQFIKEYDGSWFCRVNQYFENTESKGTVYLSDQKIRGNFTTDYNGTKVNSSVIVNNGYAYVWSGMMPSGFKTPVKAATDDSASVSIDGKTYSWDAAQIGDYDCQVWTTVDQSLFVPPTNIQFQEVK